MLHVVKVLKHVIDRVYIWIRTRHAVVVRAIVFKHKSANNPLVKVSFVLRINKFSFFFSFFLVCQLGPYVAATDCSKTCGNGTQAMNRTCLNIADTSSSVPTTCSNPSICGTYNASTRNCNPDVCISKYFHWQTMRIEVMKLNILVCTWSAWANSRCSVTCGTGTYTRQRFCQDQFSNNCTNCTPNSDTVGTRPCYYPNCTSRIWWHNFLAKQKSFCFVLGRRRRSVIEWFSSWFEA